MNCGALGSLRDVTFSTNFRGYKYVGTWMNDVHIALG